MSNPTPDWHARASALAIETRAFIDGNYRAAASGATFESGAWSRQPPRERKRVLLRFAELILKHGEELALVTREPVGVVYVNCYDADDITVPFGGFKQSGTGRDKWLHAFDKYTEIKTTWIDLS